MKNIFICEDISRLLSHRGVLGDVQPIIAAVESFASSGSLLVLTSDGKLLFLQCDDFSFTFEVIDLNVEDVKDSDWFYISLVLETNSIICVSHSGSVVRVSNEPDGSKSVEVEGQVEGGIASAQMSCDKSTLALVTNNASLILMTAQFEVIREVSIDSRVLNAPVSISWRADGAYFSLLMTDALDNIARLRSFTKIGDLHAVGRNVTDGPTSVLSGLGSCTAYSPNGSLIAAPLLKSPDRLQVAFFEPNGLRHGEFDVVPPASNGDRWAVVSLHWDASSTILAVGLSSPQSNKTDESSAKTSINYVQLYTRGNYHWYLKQQFSGCSLKCLGFDPEQLRRLYFTQMVPHNSHNPPETSDSNIRDDRSGDFPELRPVIRMVDLGWDVCSSLTEDASVAVLDGHSVLLTPLGHKVTPPPMSTYKITLPSACNYAAFAKSCTCAQCYATGDSSTDCHSEWVLACLCENVTVQLVRGDKKGSPSTLVQVDFFSILRRLLQFDDSISHHHFSFKSLALTHPSSAASSNYVNLAITFYDHGRFLSPERVAVENHCSILVLQVGVENGNFLSARIIVGFEGSVARLVNCPFNCRQFMAGEASTSGFEIKRIDFPFDSALDGVDSCSDPIISCPVDEDAVLLPEPCYLLAVLHSTDINSSEMSLSTANRDEQKQEYSVIGLSPRNRLYCGEVLLVAGVSSFALNQNLGILTYVSVGTRPALHYMSVPALIGLSALHGQHLEEQYFLECGEARPLERGSRLVACVSGQPKTVVQMPRGNLETFEPRPLILMKARLLLQSKRIYDCLLLFRRQKVDLNYLVDHDPSIFFNNVPSFVREVIKADPEYLSLFISSLEPGNASVLKYPIAIVGRLADQPPVVPRAEDEQIAEGIFWRDVRGQTKVDTVCRAVRAELLQLQQEYPGALQPLLCTYARQQPPLLEDALAYIAHRYSTASAQNSDAAALILRTKERATVLASPKVQSAIKYLAFLAEGSKLFEAALGQCDFQMARAVARQCQMDPKVYNPLIEQFESIAMSTTGEFISKPFYDAMTRFEVNYHLNRWEKCVAAGIDVLVARIGTDLDSLVVSLTRSGESKDSFDESEIKSKASIRTIDSVISIVLKAVCDHDLYLVAISQLDPVVRSLDNIDRRFLMQTDEAKSQPSTIDLLKSLLRQIRVSYGLANISKQKYGEAVTSLLSADPPAYPEAIRAARLASDWQLVLTLTGRQAVAEGVNPFQRLQRVAAELVSSFRESQEQGDGDQAECSVLPSYLIAKSSSSPDGPSSGTEPSNDRALETAQLSLDYLDDAETATAVLLLARKWSHALQTVMKKNRVDLLMDEVAPAIRDACWELLKVLPKLAKRQTELVAELTALWRNPVDRLAKVQESDPQSFVAATGGLDGEEDAAGGDGQDTRSEFSAASNVSYVSFASHASSQQSGTSTVSVLSNLSLSRGVPSSSASASAFSISGLEHSLLSRGKSERPSSGQLTTAGQLRRVSDKRQHRWDRKKAHRQFGSDPMNLKTELALCAELWSLAHFDVIASEAQQLCDALVLLGGKSSYARSKLPTSVLSKWVEVSASLPGGAQLITDSGTVYMTDSVLAKLLQAAVDDHAAHIRSHPPPVGPAYPSHFLAKKSMLVLQRFQDIKSVSASHTGQAESTSGLVPQSHPSNGNVVNTDSFHSSTLPKSWWQVAADGIILWQSVRKLNLNF